jgi:hypothetical protein
MDQSAGRRHKRHHRHHKNSWLTHVKATMKLHRGKSFKQVLKLAKKSYKKAKSHSQSGGKRKTTKAQQGGNGAKTSNFGDNAAPYA